MIQHIAELNRVLIAVNTLLFDGKGVKKSEVVKICESYSIEGRFPDHDQTLQFSVLLGFLMPNGKTKVDLTEQGQIFLSFNPSQIYDLLDDQKEYLIRGFFLDGVFQKRVKQCLRCFEESEEKETFIWSEIDGKPFGSDFWIVSHLEQLDMVIKVKGGYQVKKQYAQTVATFINEPKGYSEAELLKWLEEKKILGNAAEKLVFEFEKDRLTHLGYIVEAKCVKAVGKLKTNAGYDIESFNGKSKGMLFDRFIEVKGSGDPKLRFVWSQNEISIAKKLGDKYWIYYQGGIDKKTGTSSYKPIMIQDPFNSLDNDLRFTQTPNGMIVVSSLRGEIIK